MKRIFSNRTAMFLVLAGLFAISLQGCRGGEKLASEDGTGDTPSQDSGDGTSNPLDDQAPDNAAGFNIKVPPSLSSLGYVLHKGTGGSSDVFTDECTIYSTSSSKDIMCILEAKELDLYFNGFSFRYNVPYDMCQYFTYLAPYYYDYEPGTGPATRIDNTNGSVVNMGVAAGAISNNKCNYDYSDFDGPNCCAGSYVNYIFSKATSGADTVVASNQSWGGKFGSCLDGPALETNAVSESGYPLTKMFNVDGIGINSGFAIGAPIKALRYSNTYAANYFNTTDHSGANPLAFLAANGAPATNPYHVFTCYDRAQEVKARIRMMVRDWNLVSEFDKGVLGNPDTTGSESGFDNPANNDRYDWKDIGASYPYENVK